MVAWHCIYVQFKVKPSSIHLGKGKSYLDNKVCDKYAADMQKTGESPSPGTSHGIYLILSFPISQTQGTKRVGYKIKLDVSQ